MSEPVEPEVQRAAGPEAEPEPELFEPESELFEPEPELFEAEVEVEPDAGEPDDAEDVADAEVVDDAEAEVVDGLPVVVEARELAPGRWSANPTVQAAAAAATGFVAGAATLALMRRYGVRRVARDLHGLRDSLDSAAVPWRTPAGFGQAQTFIVQIRTVTRPRPPE